MYNNQPNKAPLPPRQSSSVYNQQNQGNENVRNNGNNSKKNEEPYQLYQQKLKALGKVRYKNQLAQLEYEQKLTELHTKYSSKTKQSVQKKLKAKNQIAEFIDEEQEEFQQQFQELMDFKYGASKWKDFHFQRESSNKQYSFCSLCDEIHKETMQEHQLSCKYRELQKSPLYYFQSIDRIKNSLKRLTSQEASELSSLADRIKKSENVSKNLHQLMPVIKNDDVLGKIAAKLQQIIEQIL